MTATHAGQIDAGRVTIARHAAKLSKRELADAAGLSRPYVTQIESGARTNVSADALARLALALGVQPSDLTHPTEQSAPRLLTVREAAAELRLTEYSVCRLIRQGRIAAARPSKSYLIPQAEIDRLLTPAERAS